MPSPPHAQDKNLALSTAGNDLTTDTISTHLIQYLNDNWFVTAGVGWQQADRAMRSASSTIINNSGDIKRSMSTSSAVGRFQVLSNSVAVNGHVETGDIGHDLSLASTGYVWSLYSSTGASQRYDLDTTNMYNPSAMTEPSDGKIYKHGDRYKSSENTQQSIAIGDTVTFTPQWSAMYYLSQSWMQTSNYGKTGGKTAETKEDSLSPNVALMHKITPQVMTYISYADSLEQGSTAPTSENLKNEGQTLDLYRSKHYELGLKADVAGMNLGAALFCLERPFTYVDTSDMVYKEQGKQVNNGLELTATGNLWEGLNVYSGVTFLNPTLKDTTSDTTRNKRVVGVPKVQANMLVEYSLPSMPQWIYSANVHYTGKRAANDTNSTWAGSYMTLDLGTRYTTRISNVPTTFRISMDNVTNEHYWASIFPSGTDGDNGSPGAFIGDGREVRGTITFDF